VTPLSVSLHLSNQLTATLARTKSVRRLTFCVTEAVTNELCWISDVNCKLLILI
jgi:hypothetical protein